jgi:ketosteroid isomerase-like protein
MTSNVETARAYYEAAERREGAALLGVLDPDSILWRFPSDSCLLRTTTSSLDGTWAWLARREREPA